MMTRATTLRLAILGLSVLLFSVATACNSGDGGTKTPCACDHLVYVQTSDNPIAPVTVHTTGNPLGTGDQVAWALITPNATISSIAMADATCGGTTTGSWTPYKSVTNGPTTASSGPMTPPPGTVADGNYTLSYRVILPTGGGPCGHIIIVKP